MKRLLAAAALTVAAIGAAVAPAAAQPYQAFVAADLDLRSGPGEEYPPVVTLPAGAPVVVHGCLEAWSWCDVSWEDARGWVAGSYLAYEQLGQRVPVAQVAPTIGLPIIAFSLGSYWDHHYRGRPWYRERERWASYHHSRPSVVYGGRGAYGRPYYGHRPDYGYRAHYGYRHDHRPDHAYRPDRRPDHFRQSDRRPDYVYRPDRRPDHFRQPDRRPDYAYRPDRRPDHFRQPDRRPDYAYRPERRPDHFRHPDRRPDYARQPDRRPDHFRQPDRRPDQRVHHRRDGRSGDGGRQPRGVSGGQTERDANRHNRQRNGPMRGE